MLSCVSFIRYRCDENSQSMEQGFPRLIADDFPGVEPKADAVLEAFGTKTLISLPMGTCWGILYRNDLENQKYFKLFGLMSFYSKLLQTLIF